MSRTAEVIAKNPAALLDPPRRLDVEDARADLGLLEVEV